MLTTSGAAQGKHTRYSRCLVTTVTTLPPASYSLNGQRRERGEHCSSSGASRAVASTTMASKNASHEGLVAPRRYRVQISGSTVMNFIPSAWLTCPCCRQAERRQRLLNLFSLRLQPGRQLQMSSQLPDRFIHCEPWKISRDLKEDASRFAKVNRVEVLAIQHRRDIEVETSQRPAPGLFALISRRSPGHMMDGSTSYMAASQPRSTAHIHICSRSFLTDCIAEHAVLLTEKTKAQGLGQELRRALVAVLGQGDGMHAPNRMFGWDRSRFPGGTQLGLRVSDQFEGEPIRVLQGKDGFVKTRCRCCGGDALLTQALDPIVQ